MNIFKWLLPIHLYQTNVAAAVVGAAVVGGVASNMAAGTAADAQQNAANQANATSQAQYNQTRADNATFLRNGTAASNQLAYELGLSPFGGTSSNTANMPNRNDIFNQYEQELSKDGVDVPYSQLNASDKAGRDATVDARYAAALTAAQNAQIPTANNDPLYNSLNKKFSQSDLNNDLVYQNGLQFGLDEGAKGISRGAAASGSLDSGATAKALTRFGNDYATTKTGDAYNRFTNDQNNQYNRLAGVAGSGQVASNVIGSAGQNAANNISNNQIGVGNSRGASAIAQGNSISNGANGIANYYQNQQYLNALQGGSNYNSFVNNSQANGFGNTFSQNGYSPDQAYG